MNNKLQGKDLINIRYFDDLLYRHFHLASVYRFYPDHNSTYQRDRHCRLWAVFR